VLRAAYERETNWAPPHVGEALRLVRRTRQAARIDAIRAEHRAAAARGHGRHENVARAWRAVEAKAAGQEVILAAAQTARTEWEQVTEPTRRMALAADVELRRRHPGQPIAPLRSAEPTGVSLSGPGGSAARPRGADQRVPEPFAAGAARPGQAARRVLGLNPSQVQEATPALIGSIAAAARQAQRLLDEMRSLPLPAADEHELSPGQAWAAVAGRDRDAVLQPPAPQVPPAAAVARTAGHQAAP